MNKKGNRTAPEFTLADAERLLQRPAWECPKCSCRLIQAGNRLAPKVCPGCGAKPSSEGTDRD